MTNTKGFRPRALGEIAIRCADIHAMSEFYVNVIGLGRLPGNSADGIVFLKVADGFGGHTSVLALFDAKLGLPDRGNSTPPIPVTGARSSLHHIALSLPFSEQAAVIAWYEKLGQPYRIETFDWIGWRGIFTQDPEGNTVELVAYDPSLTAG